MMDRGAHGVTDAGDRSERVGPRTQVGDLAQKLKAVPLFLERVGLGVGRPEDFQRAGGQLHALALARAFLQLADDVQTGAGRDFLDAGLGSRHVAPTMICRLARQLPSLSSTNENPCLESRRVRTQPATSKVWPGCPVFKMSAMRVMFMDANDVFE